jgi:guanyl-specific ribonuclease Sa
MPAQMSVPADIAATLARIASGRRLPYRNDGAVFMNRELLLPLHQAGYYHEYVHLTALVAGPGARRIVIGQGGEVYYTPDHYRSFIRIR